MDKKNRTIDDYNSEENVQDVEAKESMITKISNTEKASDEISKSFDFSSEFKNFISKLLKK